eukprot:13076455-Heterocapsa_arctica.AAC.1
MLPWVARTVHSTCNCWSIIHASPLMPMEKSLSSDDVSDRNSTSIIVGGLGSRPRSPSTSSESRKSG